jgi:hypothetical protein
MSVLILLWALLLATLVAFAIGQPGKGGALTLTYFLSLSLLHVPGVLPFLRSDSGLIDGEETRIGFETTILGMAAFIAGAVLARWIDRRRAAATGASRRWPAKPFRHLGRRALVLGCVACFVLIPISFRVPSLTSLVAPFGTLLILGFWLALYGAAGTDDSRTMLRALAPLPFLPLATLVAGGFLGLGIHWVLSVIAFLFVITKRRIGFYIAALPVMFLGLSLFVTYMGERAGIREVVGEKSGIVDRLDRVSAIVTDFQLLDLSSPDQVEALDSRLNQNWLVGAAVMFHEDGSAAFAHGATIPVWAFIPRAIWPSKPAVGGGGDLVSEFTGIHFAEGTSVGTGQVLEFYVNFGVPGVLIGFLGLGYLLMRLDLGIMRALAVGDMRWVLLRAMPGLMLLQPGGNLLEILVGSVAAYVSARLIISLGIFDGPLAARSRRQAA